METVTGTRPKEAFPPLLPPEHRSFLAPLESTPTRMSYAGNSTAGVLLVKHAQLLNVQGKGAQSIKRERGTEYQKSKYVVILCVPENGPVLRIPAVTSSLLIAVVYYQGGYHRLVPLPLPTLQSPHHPPWPS